jgi:hypothetical protein
MSGAITPLPQYALMAECSVKAQGQLYLYLGFGILLVQVFFLSETNHVKWAPVTTAWRDVVLRMEETASRYGGKVAANILNEQYQTTDKG